MAPISSLGAAYAAKPALVVMLNCVEVVVQVAVLVSDEPAMLERLTTTEVPASALQMNAMATCARWCAGSSMTPPLIKSGEVEATVKA